ncbi:MULTISPECIES: TetR/AcrR family transcriptional regulator [unclassified Rhodococcus (in: high G+C Gram-positive bacteria)]|jgi:AcrR family transcriptional regulator|uniref:TetR/AcrR family transcriptional regulator n=1 Tax=unclassified Rhodococcus (in: high G+C Gram-positive bacteria) TaxID=192944 RepID=UPI00146ADF89|nr:MULTISPECIES: TetR/AcrR family transcriptional regulator [unclassified Rhodococcus (in: high G+C Gram-positive bacteria)]NMD93943.1 helix-turn-helix transcriptional regulator [Rhodococcus sp. BL-253-APC-6A1W]NME77828.1 helix-turn-helix transcriptional regulator [Rhodococcus sp. 105337]
MPEFLGPGADVGEPSTREIILDAARTLFAERGFSGTTIRDVAEAAGVSPALVMKLTGSKAQLFQAAAPDAPGLADIERPDESIGCRMVRALVERRDTGDYEFWAMAPFLVQEAPDPEIARQKMVTRVVPRIAATIGEQSEGLVRSRIIVTLLLGLAGGLRTFEVLTADDVGNEELIETYGGLIQQVIDSGR